MRGRTKTLVCGAAALLGVMVALGGCSGDPASGRTRVVFVPKVGGIAYFDAMNAGGMQAAREYGIEWSARAPATVAPAAQTAILRDLINEHVDAIAVAPNDPASLAPVIADARAEGIHVLTTDTDAPASKREVFVNQATPQGIGTAMVDALMAKTGDAGEFAIVSCGPSAANLNNWIDQETAYAAQRYPKARLVETVYAGEDTTTATKLAKQILDRHPHLTGMIGQCTTSAPAVAQAVRDQQKIGRVYTVGTGTPQMMKPYLLDGSCSKTVLWNVESLGYLTAWTAKQLSDGTELRPSNDVSPELPGVKYDAHDHTILLGDPLLITQNNVDQYKY
ncbi:autoinducer 2 ABC transporter substrate-binding protein [Amycolatopsis panacis]|uniref:Sugar ABC transporter substrate-binding protein n=1 Tax=Amycolatopsis panacis TaxID=2340917 RepID=A0A419I9S7_9PSEU|nr:autoinducer 2 ABC transporter substrate-binding protein [Amycolatopsis panacis]RJQ89659.1 sugar ABC transporter substrate-binding protein [Amycolatopsis panacis]